MADFLQYLRQQNIFGPRPPMIGNDLPSQGGITGRMPIPGNSVPLGGRPSLPPGPNTNMDIMGVADPTAFMPPPMFDAATDYLTNANQPPMFGGPAGMDITKPPTMGGMNIPGYGDPIPRPDEMDAGKRMGELYTPESQASDYFNEMLRNYPQEQNPSWLRRIGAMIVDYTRGSKAGQEFYERPRTEAIEDWKNKMPYAQAAATNERYANANERQVAYQQMATELRERAIASKEKNDERRAAIQQQRADIYAFKARNPGWKILPSKGGNVMLYNPATGETRDSGIDSGSLTETDKIWLQSDAKLEQIAATGEQARETEGVRQEGRMELAGERGKQARETRATPPGGVTARPPNPTQIRVQQADKARELINTRPELGKWIQIGPTINEFKVTPPGERSYWTGKTSGPSPEEFAAINNFIYGNSTPGGVGGRGSMAGPGPSGPRPDGTIKVRKGNQTGRFKGTPEEARAAGYTIIPE